MKLKDLSINIFSGGTPSTVNEEYWNGDFYWLSSGETKNPYIRKTEKTITQLGIDKSSTRLAKVGDVVIASAGQGKTRGQVAYCLVDTYINQSIIAIRTNPILLDSKYLFYNLTSRYNELRLLSDSSSSRGSLTVKIFEDLNVSIPKLEKQKKIAKFLSNYDDLIENNNRRIKILEEMAQKIYKEWFVDFKFPGHETATFKDSHLGKIPKDWEVLKANNVADIFIGRTPSRKDFDCFTMNCKDRKWISIKDIGLSNVFIFQTSEYLTEDAIIKYNVPIIPKDTVILSFKLTVGKVAITTEDMCSNEAIAQFQIKDKQQLSTYYLYLYLKNFEYSNLGNTSSIGNAINSTIVKNMNILIPQRSILSEFNKSINSIFEQIKNLSIKNENLKQTRALLLPRLISGEIDVENMEII